jgi:hypothetical protein
MNTLNALKYSGPARVEVRASNRGSRRYAVSVIDRMVQEHRKFTKWIDALRFALRRVGVARPSKRIPVPPGNYVYIIDRLG